MSHPTPPIQHLSPQTVADMVQRGEATLIDVREPHETAAESIPDAVSRPLSAFNPADLPSGKLIFHCGIGKRSLAALEHCRAAGLPHDSHLAGGLAAWKQAGLPTRKR